MNDEVSPYSYVVFKPSISRSRWDRWYMENYILLYSGGSPRCTRELRFCLRFNGPHWEEAAAEMYLSIRMFWEKEGRAPTLDEWVEMYSPYFQSNYLSGRI